MSLGGTGARFKLPDPAPSRISGSYGYDRWAVMVSLTFNYLGLALGVTTFDDARNETRLRSSDWSRRS
jgi:hypothetical protein